jgi:starch-binding outer membrane protein, SusD/RagB family
MYKYIKKSLFLLFTVLFFNCTEENILDLKPINNISIDDAFTSPSLIRNSFFGLYNAAAIGQFNQGSQTGGRGYVWGSAFVQQGDNRGEDVVNTATFYQFTYTGTYDPTTANNVYYWVDGYRLINRCNIFIEGVTDAVGKGIIDQATANNYIGHAKFLRGITHFELLMYFSHTYSHTTNGSHLGIPYREIAINTNERIESEKLKPRNTVNECYNKILADLDDAENLITTTALTTASKNAAIAFKTRVYLHKRDWQKVITEGNKLNGLYTLTSTPVGCYNYNNTESIFSIEHSAAVNPGVNAALASQYKRRLLVCISPIIWRDPSWLVDDKRREEGVMVHTSAGRKYTFKYKDETTYTDPAPVIRYAEVLLNMSEAYARLSTPDLTNSLSRLNLVRNRSLANVSTQAYTSANFSNATQIVAAIIKERRIEFLMEGRRWSDIHRLQGDNLHPIDGIPAKVNNGNPPASAFNLGTPYTGPYGVNQFPNTSTVFLWPIPQTEILLNPGLANQQNPGY